MTEKPRKLQVILPNGAELDLNGPDVSKLKCERPPADTAAVLQRAEEDVNAVESIRAVHLLTLGMP
jgi:hypothetical protein